MNLVQIQEHLKDLPTQAIMGYANGQNPQVPPYLALGELNRRKQMEQKAAQPAQGTVKDSIEQQVGLMQLQKLRQGQMAQQSAMQGANAPMIPQGTPEPAVQPEAEMAMAGGGVTSLPVQDMNFGSGGIVAFANKEGKQLVEDEYSDEPLGMSPGPKKPSPLSALGKLISQAVAREKKPSMMLDESEAPDITPQKPVVVPPPAPQGGVANLIPQNVQQRPPTPVVQRPPAPPAPPAVPVAPVQTDAQKFQSGILAGTGLPTLPPEYAPPKQTPIGEDYMKYITDREQKRREDALKFEGVQKAREKRDFFNSLIAGGEATRGQKGIGSLFAGTGRSLGESATAAEERRMAFDKAQQELADNDAKTRFEINNLRRAEERGDSKAVYDSKVKLTELGQQRVQLQGQVANSMAQNESSERVSTANNQTQLQIARANNLTQLEVARINQATAMKPGETERLLAQYGALKAKDPKAAEEFMTNLERVKTGSRGETAQQKLNIQRQALAEKLPAYQIAMSTYVNAKDPAKKADALTKVRELEAMHGIKSDEAPTIDTSQWGNLKVK